jgi:hypothetical protein
MRISTSTINYFSDTLHSLDTGEELECMVHSPFVAFKKTYDRVRNDTCNITIKFDVPMKIFGLINVFTRES